MAIAVPTPHGGPGSKVLKIVNLAGGNLFALAAIELGDATQWNRIARLNGIYDPMIIGTVQLVIPPVDLSAGNGGILGV